MGIWPPSACTRSVLVLLCTSLRPLQRSLLSLPTWLQVFTSGSFVAKLFLAASDVRRIQELDAGITQCMIDMQVQLHRPPYDPKLARRTPSFNNEDSVFCLYFGIAP